MKRAIIALIATILLVTNTKSSSAQSVAEGDMQFRVYYGYPYWGGVVVKAIYVGDGTISGLDAQNTNHLGGSFDYLFR